MTRLGRTIRPFSPDELAIDDYARAQVFYRLRRYSSLAYARRATTLLQMFIGGFDAWARRSGPEHTFFARKALRALYSPLAALEAVPDLLLTGRKARAYAAIAQAGFLGEIVGRGFDGGLSWERFGFRFCDQPSVGLFAWAERTLLMTAQMRRTVEAGWAHTTIAQERPAPPHARLDLLPAADDRTIEPGEVVPITGVWVPIDVRNGCPNFLIEALPAPPLSIEVTRIDTDAWPGDDETAPRPARVDYVLEQRPTRWRLAWEDLRYGAGVQCDEPEFLDETTEFPDHPPIHASPS